MADWLISQQVVLSLTLLVLLVAEKLALKSLGARLLYRLWYLVPVALCLHNLPADFIQVGHGELQQYLVKFTPTTVNVAMHISWSLIWSIGFMTILVLAFYTQLKTRKRCHSAKPVTQVALSLPSGLHVAKTAYCYSPMLIGYLRPVLLLPSDFEQQFSPEQQKLILQHELVHYQRADNLFNALALLFVATFWFNPLVWLAYNAFRRSQELACDYEVLANKNHADKIAYSKAMLQCLTHPTQTVSLYSQYGAKHTMLTRLNAIKNTPPSKTKAVALSLLISAGLLSTITLANQKPNIADTKHSNEASPIVRIEPKYPVKAAQQNIEGSVLLQFDITDNGSTDNIKIVKAVPEQLFDQAAISALQKWRYKPRIVGGQAQPQANLLVQLDFRMDESAEPIRPLVEGIKVSY